MIGFGRGARIFASTAPTDMRKSFDSLAGLVVGQLKADPISGSVYLFVARNAKRAKVIWFDGTGFCLFQKKLAKGRFAAPWDQAAEGVVGLSASQLALFFEGSPMAFMGVLALEDVEPTKVATQIAPIR